MLEVKKFLLLFSMKMMVMSSDTLCTILIRFYDCIHCHVTLSELWLQRFSSLLGLFWLFLIVKMDISSINSCEQNFSGRGDFFSGVF